MKSPLFTRESGDRFDSCLSCEFFNPLGRVRIHHVSMWGTQFSTSKDDSLDKKQIQIIVVKVVKLIFYYQNTDMSVFIFAFLKPEYLCIRK